MLKDKDGGVTASANNNASHAQAATSGKNVAQDDLLAVNAGSGFLLDSGIVIKSGT